MTPLAKMFWLDKMGYRQVDGDFVRPHSNPGWTWRINVETDTAFCLDQHGRIKDSFIVEWSRLEAERAACGIA